LGRWRAGWISGRPSSAGSGAGGRRTATNASLGLPRASPRGGALRVGAQRSLLEGCPGVHSTSAMSVSGTSRSGPSPCRRISVSGGASLPRLTKVQTAPSLSLKTAPGSALASFSSVSIARRSSAAISAARIRASGDVSSPGSRNGRSDITGLSCHSAGRLASRLDRRIGATCAGNPRPAPGVPPSELKMLLAQYALAQHVAGAGSQQVFGEHLIGEGRCVLPSAGLEPRIQRGELRPEPCLSSLWLLTPTASPRTA
jgi:hypothetical protein